MITPDHGSRDLKLDKIQKHAHHFYQVVCLEQEEGMHGLRIHPGQIRWGGVLKPLAVEPSVYGHVGCPVEMVDVATAGLGW